MVTSLLLYPTFLPDNTFSVRKLLVSGHLRHPLYIGTRLIIVSIIALHVANSVGGAQFYVSCYQLNVGGNGSGNPSPTIRLPGAYSPTDPGILVTLWTSPKSYVSEYHPSLETLLGVGHRVDAYFFSPWWSALCHIVSNDCHHTIPKDCNLEYRFATQNHSRSASWKQHWYCINPFKFMSNRDSGVTSARSSWRQCTDLFSYYESRKEYDTQALYEYLLQ